MRETLLRLLLADVLNTAALGSEKKDQAAPRGWPSNLAGSVAIDQNTTTSTQAAALRRVISA